MNEAQTLTLESGKSFKASNGLRAYCVGYSERRGCWMMEAIGNGNPNHDECLYEVDDAGQSRHGNYSWHLVGEWVEPKRIKGFIAVKSADHGQIIYLDTHIHASIEAAKSSGENVIAVQALDILEGHGLGEAA